MRATFYYDKKYKQIMTNKAIRQWWSMEATDDEERFVNLGFCKRNQIEVINGVVIVKGKEIYKIREDK